MKTKFYTMAGWVMAVLSIVHAIELGFGDYCIQDLVKHGFAMVWCGVWVAYFWICEKIVK